MVHQFLKNMKYVHKNNKNGFLFFDLLVSLMVVMIFINVIFSTLSLLLYYYRTNKQFLLAQCVMSKILSDLEQGKKVKLNGIIEGDAVEFTITTDNIKVNHTPFFGVTSMSLFLITVSWIDSRAEQQKVSSMKLDMSGWS